MTEECFLAVISIVWLICFSTLIQRIIFTNVFVPICAK